jgi:hypothetical protein
MKIVFPKDLIPNQSYYIQNPIGSGIGIQIGIFKNLNILHNGMIFAEFIEVQLEDLDKNMTSHSTRKCSFDCNVSLFYIDDKKQKIKFVQNWIV